jgi:hypothetical protein
MFLLIHDFIFYGFAALSVVVLTIVFLWEMSKPKEFEFELYIANGRIYAVRATHVATGMRAMAWMQEEEKGFGNWRRKRKLISRAYEKLNVALLEKEEVDDVAS